MERSTKADFEESLVVYRASSNFIATALQFDGRREIKSHGEGHGLVLRNRRARMTKAGGVGSRTRSTASMTGRPRRYLDRERERTLPTHKVELGIGTAGAPGRRCCSDIFTGTVLVSGGEARPFIPPAAEEGGTARLPLIQLDSTRYGAEDTNGLALLPAATQLATASPGAPPGGWGTAQEVTIWAWLR